MQKGTCVAEDIIPKNRLTARYTIRHFLITESFLLSSILGSLVQSKMSATRGTRNSSENKMEENLSSRLSKKRIKLKSEYEALSIRVIRKNKAGLFLYFFIRNFCFYSSIWPEGIFIKFFMSAAVFKMDNIAFIIIFKTFNTIIDGR